MAEVTKLPYEAVWCTNCGKQLIDRMCFYTCNVNGHKGTVIHCHDCIEQKKQQHLQAQQGVEAK